jgi:hypothetical protein
MSYLSNTSYLFVPASPPLDSTLGLECLKDSGPALFSFQTPKGSKLPLFRRTPSPPPSKYCVAQRLVFPQAKILSFDGESIKVGLPSESRPKQTQLCLSKVDEFQICNQNLHQLIVDIQRSRSEIKTGFSASNLKDRILKLNKQICEYQRSIENISLFYKFAIPDETIQAVKQQVSLAAALIDPPLGRQSFSEKMREEKKEGNLCFEKDSFLVMALESLKQSVEILRTFDRADEHGYPLPRHICMPNHQEKISNLMRFVGSNFKMGPELGMGAWGKVSLIDLEGRKYAIKKSVTDDHDEGCNNVHIRESMVPLILDHANIIKISAVIDGNPILDFIPDGSLTNYFERGCYLKDTLIVEVLAKIAAGLSHIHEKGLIHKDIKPANILLKYERGHPSPLIIDFGSTVPKGSRENRGVAGTPLYFAPEMAERRYKSRYSNITFTPAIDVWALGHLIYEMASDGSNLFEEQRISIKKLYKKKPHAFSKDFLIKADQERRKKSEKMLKCGLRGNPGHKINGPNSYAYRDFVPTLGRENPFMIEELLKIAADCLSINPTDRPSSEEVKDRLLELKGNLEQKTSGL